MLGHEQKEQRKNEQAKATINAADAASEAAYRAYQDALTKVGGKQDDPAAQSAYEAYKATFNAGKQAKAQFVIPEKGQKGKKSSSDSVGSTGTGGKGGKDKKQASAGFNNIREFFEANPHIVPQIALMTMQPKPQGLEPQRQVQSLELDTAQRQNNDLKQKDSDRNMIAMYGKLTPEEIAKLPADVQKQINDPQNGLKVAQSRYAMEAPQKGKDRIWTNGKGDFSSLPEGEAPPVNSGYYPYEKTPANGPKGEEAFVAEYATKNNISPASMDPATRKYLHDVWTYRNPQTTSSVSGATVDAQGNRTATNRSTRGSAEPRPPSGVAPVSGMGIQPPPGAAAAPTAQGVPPTAPQGSTQYTVGEKPQGIVEEGNLPIWNRPTVQNSDGKHSTEYSTSMEEDGKEVLVPTVVNGKFLTPDGKKPKEGSPEEKAMFKSAWQHYKDTGENLGKFKSAKDANAYADTLHNRGSAKSDSRGGIPHPPTVKSASSGQGITRPPQAGKTAKAGMTPPPRGKETALTASVTRQAVKAQQEGYRKAEAQYTKDIADADKAFATIQENASKNTDPTILQAAQQAKDAAYARAKTFLEGAKASVAEEYDAAVKSIRGTPGGQSGGTAGGQQPSGNLPPGWQ
jgi:hypothetical protein